MQNGANATSICTTPMATSSHLRGQSPKAARFIHTGCTPRTLTPRCNLDIHGGEATNDSDTYQDYVQPTMTHTPKGGGRSTCDLRAGRHLAHILMCPRHESQEMAWLVTSSAQANLIGCACAAQRGAR
jgi:hypothetical protein